MSTDISIKAKETFLTIPDVDGSFLNENRSLTITKSFWYAQIFLAKTNKLPKIFFMATIPDLGDSNEKDNLRLQLYSVNYNETSQQFALNSPVGDPHVYPFDKLKNGTLVSGASSPSSNAVWYQASFPTNIDLTNADIGGVGGNKYYAYVFSSNVDDNSQINAPKIYYSNEYRQSVFPIILASKVTDGVPDEWSNEIVETISSGSGVKSGAILFGYVGNELGEGLSEFESGTLTIGSGVSSRRGYSTFIHVENASTQSSNKNSLALTFSQLSNDSISNGLSEETDNSLMKWYYYQPGSLPRTNETVLFGAEDMSPVLDNNSGFVIYYQPEKFPPYPKIFSKESDIVLEHSIIPINVIYQSTKFYAERNSRPILINEENISDVTDNFKISNFAHFQVKRIDNRKNSDIPIGSMNADYIDFTLEDTEEEIKKILEIKLSNDDRKKIRGFTNITRFKERYIAFSQYETHSDGWFFTSPTGVSGKEMRAYVAEESDLSNWNPVKIKLEYNQEPSSENDVLNRKGYDEYGGPVGDLDPIHHSRIVGVFDTTVQRSYNNNTKQYENTLFVIFQIFPSHLALNETPLKTPNKPFFALGYLKDQPSVGDNSIITFKIIPMQNTDVNDARFDPSTDIWGNPIEKSWIGPIVYPRVNADYKGSFFITPDSGGNLYVTARNPSPAYLNFGVTNTNGKFGVWSLNLNQDISSTVSCPLVKTSGSAYSQNVFDYRGFNRNISSEIEISYYLKDGGKVYFGTSVYEYKQNNYVFNATGNNTSSYSYTPVATDSYGYVSGYNKFGSSFMGEVYVTQDFISFNQIISGSTDTSKPGQEWLLDDPDSGGGIDYLSSISFLEENYSYSFPHVVNDRVSYMTKVNNILHIWMSPSVHLPTATPFHIAHDLSNSVKTERRTRLIRKFPITEFETDSNYNLGNTHNGSSTAQSNLKNKNRTKYIRKIYGGIKNGHSIFILGTDGEGRKYREYNINSVEEGSNNTYFVTTEVESNSTDPYIDNVTVGFHSVYTKIFEDFTSSPHFGWIYGNGVEGYNLGPLRVIEVTNNHVSLEVPESYIQGKVASSGGKLIITKDHYEPRTAGLRWLVYDDRIINDLYHKSGKPTNVDINRFATSVSKLGFSSNNQSPWGHYNGSSYSYHPYLLNAPEYQYYPYLNVTSSTKRISPDIGLVNEVNTFIFDNSLSMPDVFEDKKFVKYLGLYSHGSILNDIYNVNPRLVNQNGTTYLICDNGFYSEIQNKKVGKGYRVYKTYGLKQEAEKWGTQEGLDFQIFNECLHGQSNFSGTADKVYVSNSEKITFISSLKDDVVSDSSSDIGKGFVHSQEPERHIYVINNGIKLPQTISFYYKIYALKESDTDYTKIETSNSSLTLKWAKEREDLYSTNDFINIPLAQYVNTDLSSIQDLSDIVFFKHTFPTDLEAGFFRLESTNVDSVPSNPPSTADMPKAEILVKGLRVHSVDLGGAIKKKNTNSKEIAITGIVSSNYKTNSQGTSTTQPEQILEDIGGCYLSPGGFVIVNFPKPIYVSEIRFKTLYDGPINGNESSTEIEVDTLSVFESQKYGEGKVHDDDWKKIDGSPHYLENNNEKINEVVFDSIRRYIKAVRVKVSRESGLTIKIFGMKIKSLAEGNDGKTFESFGVSNANLIVVDDLAGLLRQDISGRPKAYATFNRSDSYLIYNLGEPKDGIGGYPVNRITMNISNSDSNRKIAVDVWDGTTGSIENPSWFNIYDGRVVNYKHHFVKWTPQLKANSMNVNILNITDTELNNLNINDLLKDTSFFTDLNSLTFDAGNLQNYSFRTNINRDSSLTIVGSQSSVESGIDNIDGVISLNCQMDEDGPFGTDVNEGKGIIERNLNITFPLRQIRKIRIRMTNDGRNKVYINGLKTYTPLIQPEDIYNNSGEIERLKGDPIWPKNYVTWQVRFSATSTGV